jgi:hypothetical protein
MAQLQQLRALKFLIQAARAKFPYKIRMVCGHIEVRMLNPLTVGRPYDDALIIEAASGICCECDPGKAERRKYQTRLNERHEIGG